jgi:uncharacterized membrane protein YdjX (TVP38/TMEM64 family)
VLTLVVIVGAITLLARPVHDQLLAWIGAAEPLIRAHPRLGMAAFVLLAAVSALVAFFSSALLVPVAVFAWGPRLCVLLLWSGWLIGGVIAYAIGRHVGRPVVQGLLPAGTLARYEGLVQQRAGFVPVLLLQLAIPSDVAGYLFGLVRCRFRVFLPALAAAEIPYAIGAVYLGASFLQRNLLPLVALGLLGVALSVVAARALRAANSGSPLGPSASPTAANRS